MKKNIKKTLLIFLFLMGILSINSCKKEIVNPNQSYIIYDTLLNSNFYNTQIVIRDIIESYDLNTMTYSGMCKPTTAYKVFYTNNLLIDYVEWYMLIGINEDNSPKLGTFKSTKYTQTYTDSTLIQTGSVIYNLSEQTNVKYVHIFETKLVVK